jgi:hypothetical protein
MDATLCCRCESMRVVEEIMMDMTVDAVADVIMSTLLVLPVKANMSAMYNLKMKPIVVMVLRMTEAERNGRGFGH